MMKPIEIHLVDGPLCGQVHVLKDRSPLPDRISIREAETAVHFYRVKDGCGFYVRSEFNAIPPRDNRKA